MWCGDLPSSSASGSASTRSSSTTTSSASGRRSPQADPLRPAHGVRGKFTEGRAGKGALETFLAVCAAENPYRRLRMTALADRVAAPVERADFDDLVTLVSQALPWEKDRTAGVRILLRAIGDGKADARRRSSAAGPGSLPGRRARCRIGAPAPSPPRRRLLGAVANSRGHRHEDNVAKLIQVARALPLSVGAALLASADAYTPRATAMLEQARGISGPCRRSRMRLPKISLPRRPPPASRGAGRSAGWQERWIPRCGRRTERRAIPQERSRPGHQPTGARDEQRSTREAAEVARKEHAA